MTIITKNDSIPRADADAAWKDVLEYFLEEAIAICFPSLHAGVDWNQPWVFLDKELQAISCQSPEGKRFVDKLIRVYLKNGEEKWLLIHIEVQGERDFNFSKRMFIYHYRNYDKFGRHPVSCAILTDSSQVWRPDDYKFQNFGCELSFKFPILKLLDLESQRSQLEENNNPFACVILAQLDALSMQKKTVEDRFKIKINQTRRLYAKGFTADIIRKLYHFIDALIRLPESLEIQYHNDIFEFEEVNNMPYISTIERKGIEKGIVQGIQSGIRKRNQEIILRMLQKGQSAKMIAELTGIAENEIVLAAEQLSETV